jgi:hypothetical protein
MLFYVNFFQVDKKYAVFLNSFSSLQLLFLTLCNQAKRNRALLESNSLGIA